MMSSESSEPLTLPESSEPLVPSVILPFDIIGEIAKWLLHDIDKYFKYKFINLNGFIWYHSDECITLEVNNNAIPQLNKMLRVYTIIRLYIDIAEPDILRFNKIITTNHFNKPNTITFNILPDIQSYKYLSKILEPTKIHTRSSIIVSLISQNLSDLFPEYMELFPEPFTREELERSIVYGKIKSRGIHPPPKYLEYLEQKLKEITG